MWMSNSASGSKLTSRRSAMRRARAGWLARLAGPMRAGSPGSSAWCAGQNASEQIDWPTFERFRQERMVGIGECADRNTPRVVPGQAVQVDENAHEFRNCDARMRIIELDRGASPQEIQISIGPEVALH